MKNVKKNCKAINLIKPFIVICNRQALYKKQINQQAVTDKHYTQILDIQNKTKEFYKQLSKKQSKSECEKIV